MAGWKILPAGDSGITSGRPQVQIWEMPEIGSGGIPTGEPQPLSVADNPVGEWNTSDHQIGERVTAHLNDQLVVDKTIMRTTGSAISPSTRSSRSSPNTAISYSMFIREITDGVWPD